MFEARIVCKHLPKSINKLDELLPLHGNIAMQGTSMQHKTLLQQELIRETRKRSMTFET